MEENIKSRYQEIITSGTVVAVELFNVNPTYLEVEDKNLWLIDGGIQLRFPAGIMQIGWSEEHQVIVGSDKDIREHQGEVKFKELTKGKIFHLHNLAGKQVVDYKCKWYSYEVWDDSISDFTIRETPLEIIFEFHTKEMLQIAAVDYRLENQEDPVDFRYDTATEILVSFQNIIEIDT